MFGRRIVLAVLIALAGTAAACGKGGSAAVEVVPGAPAGTVLEVSGTVTATRAGAPPRPLVVGDKVAGDDDIETGTDGSVLIELDHNHVTFTLPASRKQRVGASLAWSQPVAARPTTTDEHSAAAGRAIERSAVDTSASSTPPPVTAVPPAMETPPPAQPTPAPARTEASGGTLGGKHTDGKAADGERDALRDKGTRSPPPPPPSPPPKPTLGSSPTGGGGPGNGGEPNPDPKPTEPENAPMLDRTAPRSTESMPALALEISAKGGLAQADVAAKIALGDLAGCVASPPLTVTIIVDITGKLGRITTSGDTATTTCVRTKLAAVKFAATKPATTVVLTIK